MDERKKSEVVEPQTHDAETSVKKLKYPKAVFFIVSNEFCERFCFYGMRTILALYLVQSLGYSDDSATVVYHAFVSFCYLTPLAGAMIADSWLGKFKTIFYLSIIYAIGGIIMSASAMPVGGSAEALTYVGLVLIGFGTGGIKPCVSAFGGDQFVVPEQERYLQQFFSVFYFSVNGGSMLSTFITPILREDVNCFGENEGCYSLAFGVPAILMIVAIVIFVAGKVVNLYKIKAPEGNIVLKVCKCIGNALSLKSKKGAGKKEHWLDHSEEQYGAKFVAEVKSVLNVLVLFIPLPIFWTLFEQQGSRWTFQATRMDGYFDGYIIKPDQVQVINPTLILILIPVFETGIYPLFKKLNILQKPLHKMIVGGLLAALAFVVAAFVELAIVPTEAVLPVSGEAQLRLFNSLDCPLTVTASGSFEEVREIAPLDVWEKIHLKAQGSPTFSLNVRPGLGCPAIAETDLQDLTYFEEKATSFLIYDDGTEFRSSNYQQDLEKSNRGNTRFRVLFNSEGTTVRRIEFKTKNAPATSFQLQGPGGSTDVVEVDVGDYTVTVDGIPVGGIVPFRMGGVYSYVLEQRGTEYSSKLVEVTQPNSVNILWQFPQYFIITSGEVMFSITGLEFAFTQAPLSMKSVITAAWLLTNSVGQIIVIIIAEARLLESQVWEFALFAGLLVIAMGVFAVIGYFYKYVTVASEDSDLAVLEDEKEEKDDDKDKKY